MRKSGLVVLFLLAACQPQARRLLLLDLALSDPVALDGTARPWHDAGYAVAYRRFYPHLTRQDLERYRTVIVLGGREPEGPSDALTVGDLGMLAEWIMRGGVVVLGYAGDGEGFLDRWLANRWLEWMGAGISLGDWVLEDTTRRSAGEPPPPWAEARRLGDEPLGSVFEPFPLERNHTLVTRERAQVLAATTRHAFVHTPKGVSARPDAAVAAAARIGDGLVVVISRHALGALGPQFRPSVSPFLPPEALARTHDFLSALARWTRRPAEWAHVPPTRRGGALALLKAPVPVELLPPRLEPPADAGLTVLPLAVDPRLRTARGVPEWIRQRGLRVVWTALLARRGERSFARTGAELDSLVSFLDAGDFNLLAGDADPEPIADSADYRGEERDAVRRAWREAADRLQPTSVAWVPGFDYRDLRLSITDSSRGPQGEAVGMWCVLDSMFWAGGIGPALGALARLAADQRELIPAIAFDLGTTARGGTAGYTMGQGFCDAAWRQTLARLGRPGAFDSLPVTERYRTLRETGLLSRYFAALEDEVAERAGTIRDRLLRQRPELLFAFRLDGVPGDWFSLGFLRGFSQPDRPILLLTPEVRMRDPIALYRARGLNFVHAVQVPTQQLRAREWTGLRHVVFDENDGFWLAGNEIAAGPARTPETGLTADSLGRLLRRLAR